MRTDAIRPRAALVALALLIPASSCAINPATGKRQIMLVSEAQEKEIGRQNDEAIVAQMGVYDDPDLARYVEELGKKLAASSERPDLPWTFRLIDDPVVNAFALPGGYVYVTRGILAHFDNEAELAGVLGHEIGHITARHSASQLSKAQLANVGLLAATVFGPESVGQFGDIAGQGLGLLFLKFGRDDEKQADDLGLRYMTRVGYDPRPMVEVFETLERVSAAAGGARAPAWLSTHPDPGNRAERIQAALAQPGAPPPTGRAERDTYLAHLEGVVYGEDPRDGYFRDERFLHPRMSFELTFPEGWTTQNTKSAVAAVSPEQDAVIELTLASATTPAAALSEFVSNNQVSRVPPEIRSIHGLPAAGTGFNVTTNQGRLSGAIAFVEHDGRVFRLLGYGTESAWGSRSRPVTAAIESFKKLSDSSARNVSPATLHVVRPSRTMTPEQFAREFDASVPPETLALLNQIDEGESFAANTPYKVVRGGPSQR